MSAGKFRLKNKCGTHTEASADKKGVYFVQPGQVVEGNTDLAKRFPDKFEQVDDTKKVTAVYIPNAEDGGQQTLAHVSVQELINAPHEKEAEVNEPSKDDLVTFETIKELSTNELKEYVKENEIPIGEAKSKKDILAAIATHMGIPQDSTE